MAAGDKKIYVAPVDDDGTKLQAVLDAATIVVADDITMTKVGNKIWVLVIKAA